MFYVTNAEITVTEQDHHKTTIKARRSYDVFRRISDEVILQVRNVTPRAVQCLKIEDTYWINDQALEYLEEIDCA